MREIKFRGKRFDNGEWVVGDLMQNYIHHEGFLTIVQGGCIYYKVIPETVGQFTGLKDKNGVELYEGDQVMFWGGFAKIIYFDTYGSFMLLRGNNELFNMNSELTLVGHDNPELLK